MTSSVTRCTWVSGWRKTRRDEAGTIIVLPFSTCRLVRCAWRAAGLSLPITDSLLVHLHYKYPAGNCFRPTLPHPTRIPLHPEIELNGVLHYQGDAWRGTGVRCRLRSYPSASFTRPHLVFRSRLIFRCYLCLTCSARVILGNS